MNFKPLGARALIKRIEADDITPGGIIIPEASKEKPSEGVVKAVGPGLPDEPMTVSTEDTVLFGKWSGTEVEIEGESFLLVNEKDILGIVS